MYSFPVIRTTELSARFGVMRPLHFRSGVPLTWTCGEERQHRVLNGYTVEFCYDLVGAGLRRGR